MKRAAIYFLPFLFLYGYLVYANAGTGDGYRKDEVTYVTYAKNLSNGHFVPEGSEFLWVGPGYPLVLAPLLAVGLPHTAVKMLNAVLLYLAVLLVFQSLTIYVSRKKSAWIATTFALYWPSFDELGFMMTEPLAIFLVAGILYFGCRFLAEGTWRTLLPLAAFLGYLALTKVIFGYALAAGLVMSLGLGLIRRKRTWWRAVLALFLGLVCCAPYLAYTYGVTGKPFYWSTAGGMQLYWMTSPHEYEYGDWINYVIEANRGSQDTNLVIKNHSDVFRRALGYESVYDPEPYEEMILRLGVHQDAAFAAAAWINISEQPIKYLRNWVANVSRMLFGVPFSYKPQTTRFLRYLVPNVVVLAFLLVALQVSWRRRRELSVEIHAIGGFVLIYLGGVSLLGAYPRFFYIVMPILMWWVAVVMDRRSGRRSIGGDGSSV